MKEVNIKLIMTLFFILIIPFIIFVGGKKDCLVVALSGKNEANGKVEELIKANEDKELIDNENYKGKFIYLAFQKENEFTSFLVDAKTGEEKDLLAYIKEDKKEEFKKKVNELLYLKYPKFIADVLSKEETSKNYQILKNEFVIHYTGDTIEPKVEEKLYLRINYNEVKDCLDFEVSYDSEYENENGYQFDKNKKTVAFTFDDGPNGEKTNQIASLLEQNKAHATFFMVGNRMEYGKETILNVLNKGNEIGSHSYNHKNLKRVKIEDIVSGEEKTKEIFRAITGRDLIYTRAPYGNVNAKIKENLNTIFINWNLDTEDWLHRDKNRIVNYVMENVHDGDIILMHDLYDTTVEAVEELLPLLYAKGFQVVNISELANLKGKTLETHSVYRSIKGD